MDSLSHLVNTLFSNLAQTFPDYVYSPHPKAEEEEQLIDESESQGKAFSSHMRSAYGSECCQFMDASLTDATTVAALEKKPLLVYLACSLHENYDHYNKLLAAPHVVETFQENYVCWGCDLTELNVPVEELPAILIMYKKSESDPLTYFGTVYYQDKMTAQSLLDQIAGIVSIGIAHITQADMERQFREDSRRIVEEQQREYEEAVEADRRMLAQASKTPQFSGPFDETAETVPEAAPKNASTESFEEKRAKAEKAERMEVIRAGIPAEPRGGEMLRIRVVYPDGTKLQRNFLPSDKVALLLNLVELDMFDHQMGIDAFELYVAIPKLCLNDVGEWGDAQR
ncbi:hypothetical protein BLSTO_01921 [Blastocystis sp. subtype 1]